MRNGRTTIIPGDINTPAFRQQLVNAAVKRYNHIDALISNAGVVEFKRLEENSREVLDAIFETNCFSPMDLTRLAVPYIPAGGSMVYVSTSVTASGFPFLASYAASKAAIDSFMRCVAVELAEKGITVNSVAPGPTKTEMWASAPAKLAPAVGATILPRLIATHGEFGDPQLVAEEVIHLLKMRTVTGYVRFIDCGYRIAP